jgi:uncharacterized protein (DUF736 family)
MPAIGYARKLPDGSYKGVIQTLVVNAALDLVPNTYKEPGTRQPDFVAYSNTIEIGAAWTHQSQEGGEYFTVSLCDPHLPGGKLHVTLSRQAGHSDPDLLHLIWKPDEKKKAKTHG